VKVDGSKVRIALAGVIIGVLLGAYIGYALTPTTTFTISPGVYPGAPDYTIWKEGSNYFAKNSNGELEFSGTNATQVIINVFSSASDGDTVYIKKGSYPVTARIWVNKSLTIFINNGLQFTLHM